MSAPCSVAELIDESLALERSGDIGAAFQRAQEALEKARAAGEFAAIVTALTCVATIQFRLGHYDEARILAEEALTHAAPDTPARADALLMLGMCATETDDLAAGEDSYRRAIDLSRQLGYHRALLRGLHNMSAGVYIPRGQFDLALTADQEAYRIASARNLQEWIPFPLITIALACQLTGQRQRARAALDELSLAVSPGSSSQGYYYCLAADLAWDEGNAEAALVLYTRARSIAEATGEPGLNIWMRLGMSRYHRTAGDASSAYAWANDALTIATRVGYRHLQGVALIERGRAAWEIGDTAAAEADLRTAIGILNALQAAFDLSRAGLLLAALLHRQRRAETTATLSDAAQSIIAGGYAFLLDQERALAFPLIAAFLNSADTALAAACATLLEHLKRVPPDPLRIVTLGGFRIWQGHRLVEKRALRQRRGGELFALLLLSPARSLASDQVVEALWSEKDPTAAQTPFHHATSTLRHVLEPDLPDKFPSRYLEVEEGRVTLHLPPGSSVDFEAFETHCQLGEWEAALALYGGDLLPEYLYADWAIVPRQRLAQLYQGALLALAEAKLDRGLCPEALDACRRVLALEPWQEQAVLLGMRACLGLNDRAGARRLYRNLEKSLREDLGVAPLEELQTLFRSLNSTARRK